MSKSTDTLECAYCGAKVDWRGDTPERHNPCSKCGSTKRNRHVSISETVTIRDGIGVRAKRRREEPIHRYQMDGIIRPSVLEIGRKFAKVTMRLI